jgi:catechol 2,3-dioxygenase-like lactoylglutathione lyase family enzyme
MGAIGPHGYAKLQKSAVLTASDAGLTVPGAFRTIQRIDQRSFAEEKMSKIRHLAIKTKDPARLAKFYEEVFGLKVIHTERSGAVYMSDGYLTLALLRNRGEATPSGINHFGFQVDNLGEVEKKLAKWEEPMAERPATRPFAEYRAMDPDGNLFDISAHGYDQVEFAADRAEKKKVEKATV